ncbi:hypothetical protein HOE67_00845 [Candidatus Peregrinibacteria bacterium]|nr:hypothetical protein [Candidatus Peregrinibacteria bacterium]MBT4055636.1 hypothetical protein [Candidatus Peregrinibacteria bacterium]
MNKLQNAIDILQNTAERLKELHIEARTKLRSEENIEGYRENISERAQLLVDLPNQLVDTLATVEKNTRKEIERRIRDFAHQAQEALQSQGVFLLASLLTHRGDTEETPNDLEKLIHNLRKKLPNTQES